MTHCEEFALLLHEAQLALEANDTAWQDQIVVDMAHHTRRHIHKHEEGER
jgi:predicted protein tyrosine phosphatase